MCADVSSILLYTGNTPAAVTLERAPVTSATTGICNLTTLSPPLYYHYRVPPMYSYGYAVQGLKCQMLTSSNEGLAALSRRSGAAAAASVSGGAIPLNYGLWLVPTLPGVSYLRLGGVWVGSRWGRGEQQPGC